MTDTPIIPNFDVRYLLAFSIGIIPPEQNQEFFKKSKRYGTKEIQGLMNIIMRRAIEEKLAMEDEIDNAMMNAEKENAISNFRI